MLGYEGERLQSHVTSLINDLTEDKKILGHGKKGGETSKEQGTISRESLRAFHCNAEKNHRKNFEPMSTTTAIDNAAPGAIIKSLNKENPWSEFQVISCITEDAWWVHYHIVLISADDSIQIEEISVG